MPVYPSVMDLDARIRHAVCVVLAACGAPEKPPPQVTVLDTTAPPAQDAGAPVVETPPPPPPATVVAPPPGSDPSAMCAKYKAQAEAEAKKESPKIARQEHGWHEPQESAMPTGNGNVQCRIIWEKQSTSVKIMVQPTCCPSPIPRQMPCPPASEQTVQGIKLKLETVSLDADLRPSQRRLEWITWAHEPPRHACGRRPEGFALERSQDLSAGAVLAEMAALEAASIAAFDRLARELAHHGAPASLVARARAAKRDEVRHARTTRRLARSYGPVGRTVRRRNLPVRDRMEVALENMIEGCVLETFGAALATFQAQRAEDPAIRAAFRAIAEDERAHASLAHDVHAWFAQTAAPEELAVLEEARARTIDLVDHAEYPQETRRALGLPSRQESRALFLEVMR
jgi:hypothetical protein